MVHKLRLLWHTNSDFYGIQTPTFMPYEPFLLGVGVVFNLLTSVYFDHFESLRLGQKRGNLLTD